MRESNAPATSYRDDLQGNNPIWAYADAGLPWSAGRRVGDGLDSTSKHPGEPDTWTDVERFITHDPMQAAVGASVAGYVVSGC